MLSGRIPRRWQVAILVFLGLMVNYMLRVNLNIALIEMNNPNNSMGPFVNWTDYEEGESSDENIKSAQSLVKSAFFFGYVITQVPGGRFAEMFGTKKVFGISMMLCALLGALIPPLCSANIKTSLMVWLLFGLRLLQGLLQGVCFPSLNPLVSKWSPESEKGKFVSFSFMGGTFGTVVTYPLCGSIMASLSWIWVFYITSILTGVWGLLWFFLMFDDPQEDPYSSNEEKEYIISTRSFNEDQRSADLSTPILPLLFDMLKTPAVWVCMMGDFCNGFGLYVLIIEGPDFISNVLPLGSNIFSDGWVSAAPHLCRAVFGQIMGTVSDYLIVSGKLKKLEMQKVAASIAFLIPATGMVVMTFLTSKDLQIACIVVLSISFGFNGASFSGHIQNILSISPNRSGTLYGLTNGFGNISGFLVPMVKDWVVQDSKSVSDWRYLFIIAASLYLFETIYFNVFASRQVQEFNHKDYKEMSTVQYMKTSCCTFYCDPGSAEHNK